MVACFVKVLGCFMPQDVRKSVDVYSIDMEEAGCKVLCGKIKHHLRRQFFLVAMLSESRHSTPTPRCSFSRWVLEVVFCELGSRCSPVRELA